MDNYILSATPKIDEVLPGLFIGNEAAATSQATLTTHGITHILISADGLQPAFPNVRVMQSYVYKQLPILDMPELDVKRYFSESNECLSIRFIDSGLGSSGKVLVHCMAGVSRSATFTVAYLMHKLQIPLISALQRVKTAHPETDPNEGFLAQLRDFERDLFSPVSQYCCKMCRVELFSSRNFELHTSVRPKHFEKRGMQRTPQQDCSSYFIQQADWMGAMTESEGKLYCPKCNSKLGWFNWAGKQCSCGRFVTPGFQIHISK